ncbi:insecticidal delta-endotoxin Cry8Ea1 family protein [Bacillus thuringiensis]|uniref:insecticidal delta-endotoxin Cry8Ea1 family protein n=1 Tax=Bacillus thuringiensis TaxID=1428 RepID=UPI000CD8E108|nr:insecticidal delta-endotoxin Cry8Ea1 family protein [Bacillus thuringiensis]
MGLYDRYLQALEQWNKNRDNQILKDNVIRQFSFVEQKLANDLAPNGPFSIVPYQETLLPVYAQAANLHLMILNDVLKYGGAWGIIEPASREFYRGQLRAGINKLY